MAATLGMGRRKAEGSPAADSRPTSSSADYQSEQTREPLLGRSTVTPESLQAPQHAAQQQLRGHAAMLPQAQHPQQQQRSGTQAPGLGPPQTTSRVLQVPSNILRKPGSATALPAQLSSAEGASTGVTRDTGQPPAHPAETDVATAVQPAAVQAPAAGVPCRQAARQRTASALDTVLMQQDMALEPLLPTPTNINPIHVPGADFLQFVRVQQWVGTQLGFSLPLLDGMFVLAPSAELQQPLPRQLRAACSDGSAPCGNTSAAVAAAIPWRLRQVLSVEVSAGVDPADAAVLLVGGDRVRAGAVSAKQLADVQDYQYLCCEVTHMQQQRQMCQLQVLDVAHMAWRLKVACELEEAMQAQQDQPHAAAAGQSVVQQPSEAACAIAELLGTILKQLPPSDWVREQILQYVELNPIIWPDSPDQPWQLLSDSQYSQLLQDAAEAWQHYVQQKLAEQQPQPVINFVPWLPIFTDEEQRQEQQQQQQQQQKQKQKQPEPAQSQLPALQQAEVAAASDDSKCLQLIAAAAAVAMQQQHRAKSSKDGSLVPAGKACSGRAKEGGGHSSPPEAPAHRTRNNPSCSHNSVTKSSHSSSSRGTTITTGGGSSSSSDDASSSSQSSDRNSTASSSRRRESKHCQQHSHGRSRSRERNPGRSCSLGSGTDSSRSRGRSRSRSIDRRRSRGSNVENKDKPRPCSPHTLPIMHNGTSKFFCSKAAQDVLASQLRQQQSSKHFNPTDPWFQYVEVRAQAWLQRLAVKISEWSGPPPQPGQLPHIVTADRVLQAVPLCESPELDVVTAVYRSFEQFVWVRPELQPVAGRHSGQQRFFMDPKYHALLLKRDQLNKEVAVLGTVQQQQQQGLDAARSDWPEYLAGERARLLAGAAAATVAAAAAAPPAAAETAAAAAAAADSKGREDDRDSRKGNEGRGRSTTRNLRQRQRSRSADSSSSRGTSTDNSRSSSRSRSCSYSKYRRHRRKREAPSEVLEQVQDWLGDLAVQVQPVHTAISPADCSIMVTELGRRCRMPESVVRHYGSVKSFVDATPELEWFPSRKGPKEAQECFSIVPKHHIRLLKAAGYLNAGTDSARRC